MPLAIAAACALVTVYLASNWGNNGNIVLAGDGSRRVETELKSSLEQITNQLSEGDRSTLGALVDAVVARDQSHSLQTRVKHVVHQARKIPESGSDLLRWVNTAGNRQAASRDDQSVSHALFWPKASHTAKAACGDGCLNALGERIEKSLHTSKHGELAKRFAGVSAIVSFMPLFEPHPFVKAHLHTSKFTHYHES